MRLTFGVYTSEKATTLYEQFAPVLGEIGGSAGKSLKRRVTIQLKIYKTYDEALDAFTRGQVDFVRFGPASYVLAKQQSPDIQLLAAEQEDGRKRCKGVIVVHADSPIRKLEDLKGKRFAFGDDNSTIGRYLAQAELAKAGVFATDLKGFRYLGRHDKVAKAVELKDFDAGSVHIATFESFTKEQKTLRAIATFENVGKPWIARAGLDKGVVEALSAALLALTAQNHLDLLKVHGFLPTKDQDYDLVRRGMKKAQEFESGVPATPEGAAATRPRDG